MILLLDVIVVQMSGHNEGKFYLAHPGKTVERSLVFHFNTHKPQNLFRLPLPLLTPNIEIHLFCLSTDRQTKF